MFGYVMLCCGSRQDVFVRQDSQGSWHTTKYAEKIRQNSKNIDVFVVELWTYTNIKVDNIL